ncbi:hypothetical protein EVAR_43778_1 [Eumeta japonica]|uniref:Uncharacterized protein n=1 Tax=Eumeta variegata TaxID=151549 RepID=A0A4C1XHZ3_EUMVA|nr:hypothetical protein EVAR_43778_1 [Eumeta japonica]
MGSAPASDKNPRDCFGMMQATTHSPGIYLGPSQSLSVLASGKHIVFKSDISLYYYVICRPHLPQFTSEPREPIHHRIEIESKVQSGLRARAETESGSRIEIKIGIWNGNGIGTESRIRIRTVVGAASSVDVARARNAQIRLVGERGPGEARAARPRGGRGRETWGGEGAQFPSDKLLCPLHLMLRNNIRYWNIIYKMPWVGMQTRQTIAKPGLTQNKFTLCVWWDWEVFIIHYELLPPGKTINLDLYYQQLMRLKEEVEKRPPD